MTIVKIGLITISFHHYPCKGAVPFRFVVFPATFANEIISRYDYVSAGR